MKFARLRGLLIERDNEHSQAPTDVLGPGVELQLVGLPVMRLVPMASAPATGARSPEGPSLWFKIAVLLLAAIIGMMLASWHYVVAEGFYGRVFGQIRSGRVAMILLVLRHNIVLTSGNLFFSRGLYETVEPFAAYRMCTTRIS